MHSCCCYTRRANTIDTIPFGLHRTFVLLLFLLLFLKASALDVYDKYFGNGMDRIASNTLDILERRLEFRE